MEKKFLFLFREVPLLPYRCQPLQDSATFQINFSTKDKVGHHHRGGFSKVQPLDLRHRGLRGNKFGLCNMAAKGRSARYQTIDKHTSQNSTFWSISGLVYTRFRLLFLMFFFATNAIYVIEIFPSSLSKDLNCAHSAIRRLSQRIQKARRCIFDLEKPCDPAKDYWKFYN